MRRNDADKRGGYDNSDMKTSRTDLYNAIELVPVRNTNPGVLLVCFFFQAEDGIRDKLVTGVQTCALPICRDPAAGDDALLPAVPVRRGEGLRTLDHGELPRVLWALRRKWHPLQPRVAPAGARVRHPQGEPRRGADREGEGERAAARQPRRPARLGLCGGLRRGHVAHAAAARARGLRRGDGTAAHRARAVRGGVRPRWARLAPVREGRRAVRAAGGGGYLAGRRDQGAQPARLGAAGELRGARAHDGERGPGASGVKVLVTGADGFVGRWMVRRLVDDGREVYAAVRPAAPAGPPAGPGELSAAERAAVRWLPLELTDFESVRQCAGAPYDAVVHLAAVSSWVEAARDPGWAWTVNAAGTARLVHVLLEGKRAGRGDPVVLVASTAEVYGRGDPTPRKESDPGAPRSPHAARKAGGALAALEAWRRGGLRGVVARGFPHTGPGPGAGVA